MNNIHSLTEGAQHLLCNLAYSYMNTSILLPKYALRFQCTKHEINSHIRLLLEKGLLVKDKLYWGSRDIYYKISPKYVLKTLFFLFLEEEEWVPDMIKNEAFGYDSKYIAKMISIAKAYAECCRIFMDSKAKLTFPSDYTRVPDFGTEVEKAITKARKNMIAMHNDSSYYVVGEQLVSSILPVLDDALFVPVLTILPEEIFSGIMDRFQYEMREKSPEKGLLIGGYLQTLCPDMSNRVQNIIGCACADIFFKTGEWLFDLYPHTSFHRTMCEAIRLAYQRQNEEALKMLALAMRQHNKGVNAGKKGVFYSQISNFMMMLIYVLNESSDTQKKMEQCLKKGELTDNLSGSPTVVLANYYKDNNRRIATGMLREMLQKSTSSNPGDRIVAQLGYLLARYLDQTDADLRTDFINHPEHFVSALAIVRHELSPYVELRQGEKEELEKCFGGTPLLVSKRVKQKWEVVLESIYDDDKGGDTSVDEEVNVTARGIYIMSKYSEEVEVREQNRLKSGAWGKGKRLSSVAYEEGRFAMDAIDKAIHDACKGSFSFPYVTAIIPKLVGTTDRLYMDRYGYDMEPVTVIEEKPFITVMKTSKGISIRSNVPDKILDDSVAYHFDTDSMRITYYPMDNRERHYLQQFAKLTNIPFEAEDMLKKVLPAISDKIEIHTDFIEGAQNLKEEKANTVLCVRITPRQNQFDVSVLVTPLMGGQKYEKPGEGSKIIFDQRDGERYQIKRNKKAEHENELSLHELFMDMDVGGGEYPYVLSPEDVIMLMDFVHDNPDVAYIEWPEGEKMRLSIAQPGSWDISMKKKAGWFDIEGDVQIDDNTVMSIAELMDLVNCSRSRFVKLADDQYLAMTESLRKQLQRIAALASTSRGKAKVPAVGAALLGDALSGDLEIKHPKAVDELRTKIRRSAKLQPVVPDTLNATLRDYQFDGYQWMSRLDSWGAGACLSDDMGLGKTVQAITFMLDKRDDGPLLIVAPASVVPNWRNELNRFAPTLNVTVLNEETDRAAAIKEAESGMVILTTYGLLITQEEAVTEKQWGCICLDEAHTIKNRDTKTSAVCMKMQSMHRIILTGTPLQNHLGELWNLFEFINPGLLGSYDQFQRKFITPIEAGGNEEKRQLLKHIIQPFMLRRTKQEVATELPDKEDIRLHIELSEEEMGVYEVIRRRAKDELESLEQAGKKVNMNTLAEITRLRMAACAAQLAEKKWRGQCSKLDSFTELVQDLQQNGHRALVFSQFTSFLDMARKRLDDAKIDYFYLDGSTPMAKREKMVKEFQKGKNNFFLISLKAGGLGLNLTGANYVIHLDPWWNPAIEQQATDRAHRIGQKEKVTVYHLVSSNTIEEKILRLHEQKRDLADSLLEGTSQSHKITAKQLLEMLDPEIKKRNHR